MRVNIAICDDEKVEIDYLSLILKKWAESNKINLQISSFNSAENFLFNYHEFKNHDIILLDIQMGKINGIELAKQLRMERDIVQIIFITGFPDFIFQGYDVSALHYLLKPVKEEKLFEVLDKAYKNLGRTEKPLFLTINNEMYSIPLSEIHFIEVQGHYIIIRTTEKEYKLKMNLTKIEKELDDRFFRCQRSFIVNLAYIQKITRTTIILNNKTEIPISRGIYSAINQAVIEYYP